MISLTACDDDADVRIDRFVRKQLKRVALGGLYRLIRTGGVRINGKKCRQDSRLACGDVVTVAVADGEIDKTGDAPEIRLRALAATPYFKSNFRVIFEDDCLLVCSKPASLVVHSGSGHNNHDTLIDLAQAHVLIHDGPGVSPYLVHRLDRDTSGVIVLAKSARVARVLTERFRKRDIQKQYTVIVHGYPPEPSGTIKVRIERTFGRNDGTKMKVGHGGDFSESSYKVLRNGNGLSLLSVELHTGRTHQIRVHMNHKGCPIVGDVRYGNAEADFELWKRTGLRPRLCLHARFLALNHPVSGRPMSFEDPLPQLFDQFGF